MVRDFRALALARKLSGIAAELSEPDAWGAALTLRREALLQYARALGDPSFTGALASIFEAEPDERRRATLAAASSFLARGDALVFEELEPAAREQMVFDADALLSWVDRRLPDAEPTLRVRRALAALLTLGLVVVVLSGVRAYWPRRGNVALHKEVIASSRHPGSISAAHLTDGDDHAIGVWTEREPGPWVTVDLGAEYVLRQIRIVNRSDHQTRDGLPLRVEVAVAHEYHLLDQQSAPFYVWDLDARQEHARRIRVIAEGVTELTLSEIQVFVEP
jgi:hypothetical protein